jgi:lysyl-tRNA synthetase class 2
MPSSVVRSFHYDGARRNALIDFQSGRLYIYKDFPLESYEAMKAAFSKGEFFNDHIRDRSAFVRDP